MLPDAGGTLNMGRGAQHTAGNGAAGRHLGRQGGVPATRYRIFLVRQQDPAPHPSKRPSIASLDRARFTRGGA